MKEQLIMESYDWASPNLRVVVRNVGMTTITISNVYVAGQAVSGLDGLVLGPGQSSGVVTLGFSGTPGTSYNLKIITKTGAAFTAVLIAGSTG